MQGGFVEIVDLDLLALPTTDAGSEPQQTILITARDSAGIAGYGETKAAPGRLALAHAMCASVIGRNPYHLAQLRADWERMGRPDRDEVRAVSGGIETALADLRARQLNEPLSTTLGGARTERIPLVQRLDSTSEPAGKSK